MQDAKSPPQAPKIFDRALRSQRLEQCSNRFSDHDFLHRQIAEDLADRASLIQRQFDNTLVVGPGAHLFSEFAAQLDNVGSITEIHPASTLTTFGTNADEIFTGDIESLTLEENSYNLIVSIMDLHMIDDLPRALLKIKHSLVPDGLFLAAIPTEGTLGELRNALYTAETNLLGGVSPRIIPFATVKDLGGLLQRMGYALPVADIVPYPVAYRSPTKLLKDLQGMGETNTMFNRSKRFIGRETFKHAFQIYSAQHQCQPEGCVRATFNIAMLAGWAPHESQQKPLKPGSAQMSLEKSIHDSIADGN